MMCEHLKLNFQVDIVTANSYYDLLLSWTKLRRLLEEHHGDELGDYYENHKEWPVGVRRC